MTVLTPAPEATTVRPTPDRRGAPPTVVVLSGNPRPGSRTAAAAEALGRYLAGALGPRTGADATPVVTIDLTTLGAELHASDHPAADAALRAVAAADLVVVATPVHKASFTGLLKSFLDLYGSRGLAGVVAVPLVVPGDPAHTLVGEVHLRPVLVELGAVVPTRSLVVTAADLGELPERIAAWWALDGTALRRALTPPADPPHDSAAAAGREADR